MFKYIIIAFVIILIFSICSETTTVSVEEGEGAQLEFPYPCNSTEVTLQLSNGAPFYSSENPDVISQSNKIVTNNVQNENDTCFLRLIINPVSQSDEGTYIPIAYKNGHIIITEAETRIYLHVDYPPGKASCELARNYVPSEWVELHCTASKGSLPGQILSFQNGMRLPPLMPPHENDRTVDQTILARIRITDPVYCCSSILSEIKDMCECKDWGWNPVNGSLSNIDPCSAASTAHSLTSSTDNRVNYTTNIPTSLPPKATNPAPLQRRDFKWHFIITAIFCGSLILIFTILKIRKQIYRLNLSRQIEQKKRDADSGDYQVVHDKPKEDQV